MRIKLVILSAFLTTACYVFEGCQSEDQLLYARYYTSGKALYDQHCQNCHSADGKGLGKLIPPLTDSLFLLKNKNVLACIIKEGLNDSIAVNNTVYHEPMPAKHELADIDIAQIVTYITNSFGNKQGLYDVSRAGSDLKNCRD